MRVCGTHPVQHSDKLELKELHDGLMGARIPEQTSPLLIGPGVHAAGARESRLDFNSLSAFAAASLWNSDCIPQSEITIVTTSSKSI